MIAVAAAEHAGRVKRGDLRYDLRLCTMHLVDGLIGSEMLVAMLGQRRTCLVLISTGSVELVYEAYEED